MDELKQRFPRDMEYLISLDTTLPVEEGISEIVHTLFEAVALVILVVFVFLQNWRATLIPLVTVPVSLIGAFIFFPLLGFSINVLSLLGLVLAIGIVVDDAIVVVEAVMHHLEHGMQPKEATLKAMEEVSGPVVAIGLVLSAVFVPVGFMGGITGMFYQQFAITIALSVLLSVINALTLSPALSALLLKAPTGKKTLLTPFYNWFNRVFGRGTDAYVSFSGILIRKTARSLIFIVILVGAIVVLGRNIPAGFIPEEDQGYLLAQVNLPDASSLERTDLVMKKAEAIIKANEGVEGYNTVTGFSLVTGAYSSNQGFFFIQLKEWAHRTTPETHANGIVAALNKAFAQQIPEAAVVAFGPPAIPGLGTGAGFTMQLQDRSGGSPEFLAAAGRALRGGGAQAARDRARLDPLPRERAPGVRGHRPQQGAEGRRDDLRRQHDARRAARQLLRERLQPVRPRVQGLRAGRARVPEGPEAARAVLRAQRQGRDGPPRHADLHPPHVRPGVHEPLQPVPLRRDQRRARARLLLGPGPRRPSRRPRRRSCRRRWATSGRTCRTRRRGPPASPGCSPSPSCWSS